MPVSEEVAWTDVVEVAVPVCAVGALEDPVGPVLEEEVSVVPEAEGVAALGGAVEDDVEGIPPVEVAALDEVAEEDTAFTPNPVSS